MLMWRAPPGSIRRRASRAGISAHYHDPCRRWPRWPPRPPVCRVAAEDPLAGIRFPLHPVLGQDRRHPRHGDDRKAGRHRCSRQHDPGRSKAGDEYALTGHKWFMSAPMCDAFLVLAQAPGGLTCFLVPRFRPDGSLNTLRLQRLKDKLGNRSNASSEVEFERPSPGESARRVVECAPSSRWCS